MGFRYYSVFAVVIALLALNPITTSHALAPPVAKTPPSTYTQNEVSISRRSAAFSIFGGMIAAIPTLARAADNDDDPVPSAAEDESSLSEAARAEAAKERMRRRIAESKKNYRKSADLVQARKENTNYSCVAETGSPCPEGLVPRAVQREIVGALERLESR